MRIQITFLAALFTLLVGFQTARAQTAQRPGNQQSSNQRTSNQRTSDRPEYWVMGVQGTITVAVPLQANLSGFKCSDIVIQLGQDRLQGPLNIPTFEAVASTHAAGDITKGKCGYVIPNKSGVPVKTYKIGLGTLKQLPYCDSVDVSAGAKQVTFPTANKVETINFDGKPTCIQIK
jgi:hypothetical protein